MYSLFTGLRARIFGDNSKPKAAELTSEQKQQRIRDLHSALNNVDFKNMVEFKAWYYKIARGLVVVPLTGGPDHVLALLKKCNARAEAGYQREKQYQGKKGAIVFLLAVTAYSLAFAAISPAILTFAVASAALGASYIGINAAINRPFRVTSKAYAAASGVGIGLAMVYPAAISAFVASIGMPALIIGGIATLALGVVAADKLSTELLRLNSYNEMLSIVSTASRKRFRFLSEEIKGLPEVRAAFIQAGLQSDPLSFTLDPHLCELPPPGMTPQADAVTRDRRGSGDLRTRVEAEDPRVDVDTAMDGTRSRAASSASSVSSVSI